MERDIIIEALNRFQEIAGQDRSSAAPGHLVVVADRRLARLAIKKYNKTMKWRSQLLRHPTDQEGVSP